MSSKIAIIPARGGSKRIPRKNIKLFNGKPIIAYSIEAALKSGIFDEIMVSTDDEEIKEIALKYGANVPFMRSAKNAADTSSTYSVIEEVIHQYKSWDKEFDFTCCIYPAAPFVSSDILQEAWKLLETGKFNCVFPIIKYNYPIQRALILEDQQVRMLQPEHLKSRTQELRETYHDSGTFYFYATNDYLNTRSAFKMSSHGIVVSELAYQDIDTIEDWQIAELKFKNLNPTSNG